MPGGVPNKPNIFRGAFVEYGLSLPPVFQFNWIQLTRSRNLSFSVPDALKALQNAYQATVLSPRRMGRAQRNPSIGFWEYRWVSAIASTLPTAVTTAMMDGRIWFTG